MKLPSKVAYFSLMKKILLPAWWQKKAQNSISCPEMWHIDKLYIKLGASLVCHAIALPCLQAVHCIQKEMQMGLLPKFLDLGL